MVSSRCAVCSVRLEQVVQVPAGRSRGRTAGQGQPSSSGSSVVRSRPLARSAEEGVAFEPLFGASEERTRAAGEALSGIGGADVPDLSIYYRVRADDERLDDLAELRPSCRASRRPTSSRPPSRPRRSTTRCSSAGRRRPPTPRRSRRTSPPARAISGGARRHRRRLRLDGGRRARRRHRIIDIEGAWRFTHEDLLQNQGGVVGGTQRPTSAGATTAPRWSASSAATPNGFGVTGICPGRQRAARSRSSAAIGSAGGDPRRRPTGCSAGDIILIELHRPGPRFNFQVATTSAATSRSSGGRTTSPRSASPPRKRRHRGRGRRQRRREPRRPDLRHPAAGLPGGLAQPVQPRQPGLRRGHRRRRAPRRRARTAATTGPTARGSTSPTTARCVDAQGWGREVTTCGYGDLQGGAERGPLVHRHLQRHLERLADRRRRARLRCRASLRARGQPLLTPATRAQRAADHRLAAAGCAGPAGDAAHRQPARHPGGDRRAGAGGRQSGIATQYWNE